jgi:23S rRNA (cytosine1962-C5)-methyltransferase
MKIKLNTLWNDYELIDCGNHKKLERFGEYTLIRPEISAENKPKLSNIEWKNLASAEFIETSKNSGRWEVFKQLPDFWSVKYENLPIIIKAQVSLTNSKHIGVFPEQVINWQFLKEINLSFKNFNTLNLFAYTGLSSIASSFFAEKVTHIDSIKKMVNRAKDNASASNSENIRFIVEDAYKFVLREIKRNNKYNGIILDPPPIGTGPNNEKWILEEMLDNLLLNISQITASKSFIIMNLYSYSINEKYIHKLIFNYFPKYSINMCKKIMGLSNHDDYINHGYFIRLIRI